MNPDFPAIHEIWVYLSGSPLLALILTLGAYQIGVIAYDRANRHPLANPVLIAIVLVAATITLIDMPYPKYFEGAQFVHFLLGTATVSLAVPIYKGLSAMRGRIVPLLAALLVGGVTSIASAVGIARLLGADAAIVGGFEEEFKVVEIAIVRVDGRVVSDVVTVVLQRRREERHEPDGVDTQFLQIVEFLSEAAEIADAIAVGIEKRADVDLVNDGILVPECVLRRCQGSVLPGYRFSKKSWCKQNGLKQKYQRRLRYARAAESEKCAPASAGD